jgi:predicted transcriptional regulator
MSVEDQQRRTSQIVAAYVRKNLIPTDQIGSLIASVHSTLSGLGNEIVEEPSVFRRCRSDALFIPTTSSASNAALRAK